MTVEVIDACTPYWICTAIHTWIMMDDDAPAWHYFRYDGVKKAIAYLGLDAVLNSLTNHIIRQNRKPQQDRRFVRMELQKAYELTNTVFNVTPQKRWSLDRILSGSFDRSRWHMKETS